MDGVKIETDEKNLLKVKSPHISQYILNEKIERCHDFFQTFDFVEIFQNSFKLIGRDSQIFKFAGKRYSTIQIENISTDNSKI